VRRVFGREDILNELKRIGRKLKRETTIFLIGGAVMSLDRLKRGTKDIDVILTNAEDFNTVTNVLKDLGCRPIKDRSEEYLHLGASLFCQDKRGCRFDLFLNQVVKMIILSEEMKMRSRELGDFGNLKVRLVSNEDIFLFKSVSVRRGDLEDMRTLVEAGLDYDVIFDEIMNQKELQGRELWITFLNERLDRFTREYGVSIPIKGRLEKVVSEINKKAELLRLLSKSDMTLAELDEKSPLSRVEIQGILKEMVSKNVVSRADGRFKLMEKTF
jgi:hypothetical protein